MRFKLLVAAITVVAIITHKAGAQQLKPIDPSPFVKPEPICSMTGTVVRESLQFIVSVLQGAHFEITNTNWDEGIAEAKRVEASGENRIVVWLQWDIARPGQQFKVFFIGARFEGFFGRPEFQRVLLNAGDYDHCFSAIRKALINAAFKRG